MAEAEVQPEQDSVQEESIAWNELPVVAVLAVRAMAEFLPKHNEAGEPLKWDVAQLAHPFVLLLPEALQQAMQRHVRQWMARERMGILLGTPYRDPKGFLYTVVTEVVLVEDAEASPVQVKLRSSAWKDVWQRMRQDGSRQMVGWYHSHPGYGIFLSATDKNTQHSYFSAPWQVAVVIDPVREEFGVFAGQQMDALPDSAICRF